MEKRRLGSSDLEASVLGLGCNNFGMKIDLEGTRAVIDAALEVGIDFLDTADMYGETQSESFLGEVLEGRRERFVLATKFGGLAMVSGETGWGRKESIVACLEASLGRLRTDRVDLYQLHYPDPETPLAETLGALDELHAQGKIRAVGFSNVDPAFLDAALALSPSVPVATVQNEWSLLARAPEEALVPACAKAGISFLPYFPLASGVLTGKYKLGEAFAEGSRLAALDYFKQFGSEENLRMAERLSGFAADHGRSLLELAFGWLASQPVVASVIAGASRPEQVHQNAKAMGWRLTEAELAEVDALYADR